MMGRKLAQLIPARTMVVTAIRKTMRDQNGESFLAVVGWRATCFTCTWTRVFMAHQYDEARKTTRTHKCSKAR